MFCYRCISDFDHPQGLYASVCFTVGLILVFIFCAVSYTSVWITITSPSRNIVTSLSRNASDVRPSPGNVTPVYCIKGVHRCLAQLPCVYSILKRRKQTSTMNIVGSERKYHDLEDIKEQELNVRGNESISKSHDREVTFDQAGVYSNDEHERGFQTTLSVEVNVSPNSPGDHNISSMNLAEGHRKKLHKTAKIMTLFVAMYGLQWGFYLIYSLWHIIGTPHISIVFTNTIFVNLGGVFNYFAYTYMRIKYIHKDKKSKSVYTLSRINQNNSWLVLTKTFQWRHNERDGVSNHQCLDCLLKRLFRRKSKKSSKLRGTGLCEGNSSVTGEFPVQRASNTEDVPIWWRHHELNASQFFEVSVYGILRPKGYSLENFLRLRT